MNQPLIPSFAMAQGFQSVCEKINVAGLAQARAIQAKGWGLGAPWLGGDGGIEWTAHQELSCKGMIKMTSYNVYKLTEKGEAFIAANS